MTVITLNKLKNCFNQRNEAHFDKSLSDQHNQGNNLWKFLMNLQFTISSRNRVFFDNFFKDHESLLPDKATFKKLSIIESSLIKKIHDTCSKGDIV